VTPVLVTKPCSGMLSPSAASENIVIYCAGLCGALSVSLYVKHQTCPPLPGHVSHSVCFTVTGQLEDTPTRGLPTRGLDDSRTGHLADWSTRGLDNSRTGQVADWTIRGCHRRLCVLSFPFWRHLRDRELSSRRVDQSARCPVRELSRYQLTHVR